MTFSNISWKSKGVAFVTLFFLAWLLWNNFKAAPNTTPDTWSHPPQAVRVPEVVIPGPKRLVTLDKEAVSRKLKLPSEVKDNLKNQVLTTSDITTKRAHINTVTYLNMSTGRATTIAKEVPPDFFRFENIRELGVRAGVNHKLERVEDLHGRWQFLGIGKGRLGAYGELGFNNERIKEGKIMLDFSGEL